MMCWHVYWKPKCDWKITGLIFLLQANKNETSISSERLIVNMVVFSKIMMMAVCTHFSIGKRFTLDIYIIKNTGLLLLVSI